MEAKVELLLLVEPLYWTLLPDCNFHIIGLPPSTPSRSCRRFFGPRKLSPRDRFTAPQQT